MAIFVNNQTPQNENNVGQFGASTETIGAYKQAAEYAADAEYWAKLSEQNITSIEELLALVEELYRKGDLQQRDIEKLKADFQAQDARLMQLISQANTAADNANNAVAIINQKIIEIQAQLDIIAAIHVTVTTLPPGTPASGNYNNATGELSLGLPQGAPGKDGSVTDLGTTTLAVPASDDFGFFVDKDDNKVYKTLMSDIAKTFPSVTSIAVNGGAKKTGDVTITKTDLGINNVLNVPSYSKTESDNKSKGYVKSYLTKALADADADNRTVGEVVLVWSNTKYDFYTVTAGTPKTLTLNTSEKKIITVNRKEPDSAGNIDITIPTGNPSLYLGELLMFPYDPDRPFNQPGVLPADGRLYDRTAYTELFSALVRGDLPCVSETEWQAGKKSYYSWGPNGTSTTGTQFRVPDWASGTAIRTPDATADSTYDGNVFDQIPYVATVNGVAPDDSGNVSISSGESSPFPDVWAPLNDDLRLLAGVAPYDRLYIGSQYVELTSKSLSFSRASTATYIDKSGVLQTAAIDEPRFEKEGLLIEGQSTNLVPNSSTSTIWKTANATAVSASIVSPDGTTSGVTRLFSSGTPNTQIGSAITVPMTGLTAGGYCSFSVFAKADTHNLIQLRWAGGATGVSSRYLNVDLSTGEIGANTLFFSKAIPMNNGWWRIIAVTPIDGDLTGGSSADPGVELISSLSDGRRPSVNMAAGVGVYLYGPQFESGVATSYIATTGSSVTRAADDCTLQRSGNDNYFGPVTIAAEIHCNGQTIIDGATASRRGIISVYPTTTEYIIAMISSSSGTAGQLSFAYADSNFLSGGVRIDDGNSHIIAMRANTSQRNVCVDGAISAPAVITRPTPGTVSATNQTIMLGRGAGATNLGQRMLNGHIRNLRIWHKVLNDNQIKSLR